MSVNETRIGVMGGTFDPVHLGHLVVAEDVFEKMGLDKVLFVPAAQNPLKGDHPEAEAYDRLGMLKAAVEPFPQFEVQDFELRAGGISYTLDSVEFLATLLPDCRLFWIIGADQVANLDQWHRIAELAKRVEFVGIPRPGYPLINPGINNLMLHEIEVHSLEISSCEIRSRIRAELPVSLFLPPRVDCYIASNGLYRKSGATENAGALLT